MAWHRVEEICPELYEESEGSALSDPVPKLSHNWHEDFIKPE